MSNSYSRTFLLYLYCTMDSFTGQRLARGVVEQELSSRRAVEQERVVILSYPFRVLAAGFELVGDVVIGCYYV